MKLALSMVAALWVLLLWTPDWALAKPKDVHGSIVKSPPFTSPSDPNYKLVLTDKFDKGKLNTDVWDDLEASTSPKNVTSHYSKQACVVDQSFSLQVVNNPSSKPPYFTCGVVVVEKYALTYGKYEVHARIDKGEGWEGVVELVPLQDKEAPQDVILAEYSTGNRQSVTIGAHYTSENIWQGKNIPTDGTKFHTFTLEWTPSNLRFFIDCHFQWETTVNVPTTRMSLQLRTLATDTVGKVGAAMAVDLVHVYMYIGDTNHTTQTWVRQRAKACQ